MLLATTIKFNLDAFYDRVFVVEETHSTNERIKEETYFSVGNVLLSKDQTHGKGTHGNTFYCEKNKGVYGSFILDYNQLNHSVTLIPLIMGLAIAKSCLNLQVSARLKWINDVVIDNKKVAGILCESVSQHSCLIVGFGINVLEMNFPASIKESATYLQKHSIVDVDFNTLVVDVLNEFIQLSQKSTTDIIKEYTLYSVDIGKKVLIQRKNKEILVTIGSIHESGMLLVVDDNNIEFTIHSTREIIKKQAND